MSDDITRISLDTAIDGDRTDWARLDALSDEALDAAISDDPDTFSLDERQPSQRVQASYRYQIVKTKTGRWRWRLVARSGEILAASAQDYAGEPDARRAVARLKIALLQGTSEAA